VLLSLALLPVVAAGHDAPAAEAVTGPYACRQEVYERRDGVAPLSAHVSGLVEAPNGDLLFHFDGNANRGLDPYRGEDGWGITRAFVSRMAVGSNTWERPAEVLLDSPESAHNTVLFNDGAGRIHNFFTVRQGGSHSASTLDYRYSDDSGHSWSDPEVLREQHGWMFGNRPFRMTNGEAIVPVYKEAAPWGVGFFISDDNFQSYSTHPAGELPWPGVGVGGLQAATTELQAGHLLAFMRTQADFVYRTESFDYGRTWTPAVPTEFPNPWARVDLLKLDSGNLLLAYNPSGSARTPLVLALSEDGGLTWPHTVTVEDEPAPARHSYPFLLQSSDGAVHLGYSHREGFSMRHIVFNEEYVRSGPDMASDASPHSLELRDGELIRVDECGYAKPAATAGGLVAYACRQDIHPQDPDFPGVHVAGLEEAPNGDLLYIFYAGSREGADDVKTYMSRLAVGSDTWTKPEVVFDEPNQPDGNAVLWTDDDNGKVHLLFSTIMGGGWTEANLRMISSEDSGSTWSEPKWIREEWGWLFGTLPFRMSNGEVIVPIYSETEWSSGFYVSDDDLDTVTPYPSDDDTTWPRSLAGMIQPATVELEPGHLLALNRSRDFHIWKTESFDYGRTWTDAEITTMPNNNSRLALLELANGHLVLAHNPTRSGRTPLRLSLSTDGGQTWGHWVDIENEFGEEFSYPYLLQTADGMIHLGYTHRRESMRHLVFNEEFVRSGLDIPSNGSFEVKAEHTGGALRDVATCGYAIGNDLDT
jgi:predicted neuraminidase